MRASRALTAGVALALTVAVPVSTGVSAHRLDEYLQAARIGVQPDGVSITLDLTPGTQVADSIIALIDRDRDGTLSADEQQTYAGAVIRALEMRLDGEPLSLRLTSSTFPPVSALRRGEGTIRLRASASHPTLAVGKHQLFFRNGHLARQSVYLANALVPESPRIAVTEQRRDSEQRQLTIYYLVSAAAA
jgi:hypothetical protein